VAVDRSSCYCCAGRGEADGAERCRVGAEMRYNLRMQSGLWAVSGKAEDGREGTLVMALGRENGAM